MSSGISPVMEQFLITLHNTNEVKHLDKLMEHNVDNLGLQLVMIHEIYLSSTHNVFNLFISFKLGKDVIGPLKSDINLMIKIQQNKLNNYISMNWILILNNIMNWIQQLLDSGTHAHNSVKFFNWDIIEGMGPSIDVPCRYLQQFNMFIDY